jgi:glycosyltransferase involved in cell wall biosynthesis
VEPVKLGANSTLDSNKGIKSLVLTSSFPRFIGDHAGVFVYRLAQALNEANVKSVILAPRFYDHRCKYTSSFEILNGVEVHRFIYLYPIKYQRLYSAGDFGSVLKTGYLTKMQLPLFIAAQLHSAIKLIFSEKIDVIHTHWLLPQGFTGAILKKVFNIKHVTTLHSSEITFAKKILLGQTITRFTVNNADVIVSVSRHRAEELLAMIPSENRSDIQKKIRIIPMGVNLTGLKNKSIVENLRAKYNVGQKRVILFVGRLVEVKGCKYLIQAMSFVTKLLDDVILLILGSGPLENELRSLVKECQLGNYVRFEGFVNPEQICEYYILADLLVFPSIVDSSGFDEGLPVVLLEALAFGKPIVSTRVKGALEVIEDGHNGVFVEQKNPEQIAKKTIEFLTDDHLRERLAEQARISAKKYDWHVIAQQYADIYKGLM